MIARRIALAASVGLLGAAEARAARQTYSLGAFEIAGSTRVATDVARQRLAGPIDDILRQWHYRKRPVNEKKIADLRDALESQLRALGGFGWTKLEILDLTKDDAANPKPLLFLFDVVEKQDLATRLPLRSAPAQSIRDSAGLLDAYAQYEKLGWDLVNQNKLSVDRQDCPAFYCTWGSATPALAELERRFAQDVPNYRELLRGAARDDRDPARRARAMYLLTYLSDGAEVSAAVAEGLLDPSDKVRAAAMQIITDMAVYHAETPVPVDEVLRTLDFPFPEDRNRALALFLSIASSADYRDFLLYKAGDRILPMLRSRHPVTRSNAYTALTILSGEGFPENDHDAWDRWLWKAKREELEKKQQKGQKSIFDFLKK